MTLIIGMTIKFVNQDRTLRNLLLVCRDFNDILKPTILKQSLLRADQQKLAKKRRLLWIQILKLDVNQVKQEFAIASKNAMILLPQDVKSTIEVDIHRTLNTMKGISSENLRKILMTYAVLNSDLDYCQGMNFIAGFLFLFFRDEALAFAVMRDLIRKFNMTKLFNTELPMLKLNFYQLDRLISILLPDLHAHFKVNPFV
jgi:hypothetical protein